METQKIVNLLVMAIMNLQNLQQENGMLSMIKITQTIAKEMKMLEPLNLKPKSIPNL